MTETLKSVLAQQAASVAFKPPDLEAIARDHNRNIRRRRVTTVLATVAAVAVVAGTAGVLLGQPSRQADVAEPLSTGGVSWAVGSTIYHGSDTIDVGHKVKAMVRTSVGFVTVDDANNVYSVTGRGVTRIGQTPAVPADGTDYVRLVSDPQGTLAGWIGGDYSGAVLKVHDQATGQTRTFDTDGAKPPYGAVFFAIDDRTAYWRIATRGAVLAVDVDTGAERQLASSSEAHTVEIWSVENGVLAFSPNHRSNDNPVPLRVGRSIADGREITFGENAEPTGQVVLSPTGEWMSYLLVEFNGPPQQDDVRAFAAQVRDTRTDELVTLNLPQPSFAVPVVWLDGTTVQVLVIIGQDGNMYACAIPEGSCTAGRDIPRAQLEGNGLVLPNGRSVTD
jgi:hypothetical protein